MRARLRHAEPVPAWRSGVHLAALSAFALARPLFDILSAGTLVEWDLRPLDVVLAAVGLVVLPPLALLAAELAVGLVSRAARRWLHLAFVAGLCVVIAAYALRKALPAHTGFPVLVAALAIAVVAAGVYDASAGVRSFVTLLGVAPPLFLCLFLFGSSATRVVFPAHTATFASGAAPTPVVMVVFDEFPSSSLMTRDRRIDRARYPAFGALAGTSTWYRNAVTAHDFTRFSVPAIASGAYSRPGTYPVANDHRRTLFQLLARSHRLEDFETVTRVCPASLCKQHHRGPFPERIDRLLRQALREHGRFTFPERHWARKTFPTQHPDADLARFAHALSIPSRRPRFAFIEVQTPHQPWVYLPSGRHYRDPGGREPEAIGKGATPTNRLLADQQLQRHLAQVGFTDLMLGRILAALRRSGELDRTLLVVTADHGISVRPGQQGLEHRLTTPANVADTAPVPLFVKLPGQRRGRIDDSYARNIDAAPTIAAQLHARLPWRTDGRALGAPRPMPATLTIRRIAGPPLTVGSAPLLAARDAEAARVARLGSGPAENGLPRFGPRPRLVGRPPPAGRPGVIIALDDASAWGSVDLRGEVPAIVSGTVLGPAAAATKQVAIVLNGRVAATAWTYVDRGRIRFAALTGDRRLRQGRNSVAAAAL